jgi:MFS family permease
MLAFRVREDKDRDLSVYLGGRFLASLAAMVQSVAVGWQVYERAHTPLALGLAGLAQFVPMFLLMLPAGELCDRVSPRRVLATGLVVQAGCGAALVALSIAPGRGLGWWYGVLALCGAARALSEPAEQALLPLLVEAKRLPEAIGWNSTLWQVAVIGGPALGGLLYGMLPTAAYAACCGAFAAAAIGVWSIGGRQAELRMGVDGKRGQRIREGIRFVAAHPVVLGAISLDLFAVLFGGATALLPVYARDILHVGAAGLGLLRSAPAAGACAMAMWQTARPVTRRAGPTLFASVALFGAATVVFGVSRWLPVSLIALCVLGASDMVSVNIRCATVQLATPDAMRGRVSAVNMLFVGASSELGEFESGVTAAVVGTVPAVVLGGIATLAVAAVWMRRFPRLREMDGLTAGAG